MYDTYGKSWSATKLFMNQEQSKIETSSFSAKLSLNPKFGPKTDELTAQLGIAYEHSQNVEQSNKITVGQTFAFSATNTSEISGIALMLVPSIRKTKMEVYLNGSKNEAFPVRTTMNIEGQVLEAKAFDLKQNPSNVLEPALLNYWQDRAILQGATALPSMCKIQSGFTVGTGESSHNLSSTIRSSSKAQNKLEITETISVPFFEFEEKGTFEWEHTVETEFNNSLTVSFSEIPHSVVPDGAFKSYHLTLYVLNDGQNEINKRYYEAMKDVQIKIGASEFPLYTEADGTPFILAWEVNTMSLTIPSSIHEINQSIKIVPTKGGLYVNVTDKSDIPEERRVGKEC